MRIRAITVASFPAASEIFYRTGRGSPPRPPETARPPRTPAYWVVLNETVLRRPIGVRKVMRTQLEHLISAAAQPEVA
jgi:hypothetical protein